MVVAGLIAQEEGPSASAGALAFRRASGSRATVARAQLCYSYRRSNRTLMERKLGPGLSGRSPDHHPFRRPRLGGKMDTKPKDDQPTDFELERAIFGAP